jgi:predicted  nucleic acid-binding Zn-ribbon protein
LLSFQKSENELNAHISSLKLQIEEHNTLIKSKNKTIEDLQNNINSRWSKGDDFDKLTIENNKLKASLNMANQEIETLKLNDQRLSRSKALSVNNMNTSRKEFDRQENTVVSNLQQ